MISHGVFAVTAVYSVHGTLMSATGYVEATDMRVAETYVRRLVSVLGQPILVTGVMCDPVDEGIWFGASFDDMVCAYYDQEKSIKAHFNRVSKYKWN